MNETWNITQLAKEFDVTPRTIRFYEDKGLVSPQRKGQHRIFHARDRVRLQLVMRGKRLGFSLNEIQKMIDLYDADPSEVSQLKLFVSKLRGRREYLELQREDIDTLIAEIREREHACEKLLREK